MPETSITPPAVSRPSKPVSEALLNEKVSFITSDSYGKRYIFKQLTDLRSN